MNDELKLGFVHIPKTGGGAIISTNLYHRVGEKHDKLSDLENPDQYRDYDFFTIVRNPFTRYISEFRYRSLKRERPHNKYYDKYYESLYSFMLLNIDLGTVKIQKEFVEHDFLEIAVHKYETFDFSGFGAERKDERTHYLGEYNASFWADERGLQLIADLCKVDFDYFGYPCELAL